MPRYKLGKLPPKKNSKTLDFAKYLLPNAPPPPPEKTYWEYKIPPDTIGMYDNDQIGDCTCAEVAHHLMLVTAHTGKVVIPEVADVVAMYSAICGYDPSQTQPDGSNPTDTGCAITDVLNYWQLTGLAGHKILGWAAVDYTNLLRRSQGVYIFAGCSVGVQLPAIAQTQFSNGQTWDVVADDGGIDGGHNILESGYGDRGRNYETWGQGDQKGTNAWDAKYADESYIVITSDWVNNATGLAPNQLNMDALQADLKLIAA
jgi:hypothetical protein